MFIYVLDYSVCRIAKIKVDTSDCGNNLDKDKELIEYALFEHNFDIDNCEYMITDEDLELEEYG